MSESTFNPAIKKMYVGNRVMREITVYPLSTQDEIDMSGIIAQAIKDFATKAQSFDDLSGDSVVSNSFDKIGLIEEVMNLVVANLGKILEIVSDVPKDDIEAVTRSMTNAQVMELVNTIWEDNYEVVQKNVRNLLGKVSGKAVPSV